MMQGIKDDARVGLMMQGRTEERRMQGEDR